MTNEVEFLRDLVEQAEFLVWELYAERTVLRKALKEACDEFEDASQYKGEYMRKKHGDDETLARLRALLPAK